MKLILIFLILVSMVGSAQTTIDTTGKVDSAFIYLTGVYKNYQPKKAFALFMQRALNGEAKAMNAVGLQYAKGLGVDSNFTSATYWLKQAATNGYTKAFVNIGMLYKHRLADSTDLDTAYRYFDTALKFVDTSAWFAKGYMLYKGLGCGQDYGAALTLFRNAANAGRADGMYFSGLCFKNGYGIAANADSATYFINQSAMKGYKNALAEIAQARGNDSTTITTGARSRNRGMMNNTAVKNAQIATTEIPDATNSFKRIEAQALPNLSGIYEGTFVQYDYSGKKVIRQATLKLNIYSFANKLYGEWIENDSIIIPINALQTAKGLEFDNMSYTKEKVNSKKRKVILFKTARFRTEQRGADFYLCGNLILLIIIVMSQGSQFIWNCNKNKKEATLLPLIK